ncbi:M6 family metalloprotease domain-containing protein, partial [Streptomyces sp. B1866]|uniref:M6 family metalloprotease domain-containing protein n=1 Tax=Streptomyces sp. B1866 TaxID=3075431 RepID=UPI002890EE71
MARCRVPQGPRSAGRPPSLRRAGAVLTSLSAVVATTVVAGPVAAAGADGPCTLRRTGAHHSEGLDSWDTRYPRPTRALDAVMVFLAFPDARPRLTPRAVAADHVPGTTAFFRRASYGRFRLRVHPVNRWIAMPRASSSYAIRRDWDTGHRAAYLRDALAAADPAVDFRAYDIVYLVADPDAPGVDPDATKVVNFDQPPRADGTALRRLVTVFERHPPDRHVLAHETGHVLDLPDLYHRPEDGGGDWDTHVGDWDLMGSQFGLAPEPFGGDWDLMGSQFGLAPEPFGWHKWKLGWLTGRQVACVRATGGTRHTLRPLSAPMAADGARPGPVRSRRPGSVRAAAARAGGPGGGAA